MTGYSSLTTTLKLNNGQTCSLAIELKSINSRFFEVVCKLPSALGHLEVPTISSLQKKLIRGRVFLTIRFEDGDGLESIAPSLKTARGYVDAVEKIKAHTGITGVLSINDLLQLPNLFSNEKSELHQDDEKTIMEIVTQAAEKLMETRADEGKTLEQDFVTIFTACKEKIIAIEQAFESAMHEKKEEIKLHVTPAQDGDATAKTKLEELYAELNKIDIHEEITRFKSHLTSVNRCLGEPNIEKGKRLDFILQELLREVNTIMAKSSHFNISSSGIDIKVELEKAREQVQNII